MEQKLSSKSKDKVNHFVKRHVLEKQFNDAKKFQEILLKIDKNLMNT